ncbi:MAG: ABC transporter ATP-binding protein/permease [Bacilli bacterium]|nr:ABC transporter ATP-binding protein/permease [Bacilli bacterium]
MSDKKYKRSDRAIPDCDHLFNEDISKSGKRKSKFFRNLIFMNKWTLLLSTLVYIFQALPTFVMPICTSNIINIVQEALSTPQGMTDYAWQMIAINAGVTLFSILLNIPMTILRWRLVSKMLRETSAGIKCSLVRKLQHLSITYYKNMESGKIQAKFLKDCDSVDLLLNGITFTVIPNVVSMIISAGIAIYKNAWVALFFVCVIPINVILVYVFRKKIRATNRAFRLANESVSTRLTNMLDMLVLSKAHGLEQVEINDVTKRINELEGSGRAVDKVSAAFGSAVWVVSALLSMSCLVFCAVLAAFKIIQIGDVVLFQSMFVSITGYITVLINMAPQISVGLEGVNSLNEIMNNQDIESNLNKTTEQVVKGDIRFEHVTYAYPGTEQRVIDNFNFEIKAGECVAFVGSSGSGKSTTVNLIIGLLKPLVGHVYIDGIDLNELNLTEYRHNISVVPQNSILFAGSIKENITFGLSHYSEEDLNEVIKEANLDDLVNDLPKGLNTVVGEKGDKLSGGQKQRISIARALIRKPKILILDEATSALDNISEYKVQKAIDNSTKNKTTIIVAHRLSTIRHADKIVVMDKGHIAEVGTYRELLAKKGLFYELKRLNEINEEGENNELNQAI